LLFGTLTPGHPASNILHHHQGINKDNGDEGEEADEEAEDEE
jgi:hypothetical protein